MGEKDINILNRSIPKDKLIHILEAEVCRRSLFEFFKMSAVVLQPQTEWSWNWHFKYISDLLQEEVERLLMGLPKDRDYVINLPFRSGKSTLISVIFPVWCWLKSPGINLMTVSATEALAVKFSHQSKMLIESKWFKNRFPDVTLRPDSKSKGAFINTQGGRRESFGISSLVIGSGCNIMICDDLQSPSDVTPIGLKNTIESFQDVLYSRLDNPGIDFRVLLQQRVHENDISGYLTRTNPDKYFNIVLPVILTEDLQPKELIEYYTQKSSPDDPEPTNQPKYFWPQRFNENVLADFRTSMRPNMYAGQLLQRPTLEEGEIIKRHWFKYIKLSELLHLAKNGLQWNMVIDTAFTSNKKNDPTSIMIVTKVGNNLYIRNVYQRWLEFWELITNIQELQLEYNIKKIYIEEKGSGISIMQQLKQQTNFNIIPLTPGSKDKISRVNAITPVLEGGRVFLIEDQGWNDLLITECSTFPYGLHDDMVDCLTYSISEFLMKGGVTVFKSI
jgi:predicted phage terminase large subunit-like protein